MKQTLYLVINSLNGGGAERVASRLSEIWSLEYNLKIISLMPFTNNDYFFYGEKISIYSSYKGLFWLCRIKNAAECIDNMAEVDKPVAIISFLQNANLCVALTSFKTRKILSIRNFIYKQYSGLKRIMWYYLIRRYFNNADYIVSVSELINSEMINKYKIPHSKCVCIYNPYDIVEIKKRSKEQLSNQEQLFYKNHSVICNIGHLSIQKGQFHLIRIIAELCKTDNRFGLVIVGRDDSLFANKIKKLAADLGVSENIYFSGIVDNPYKYVSRSDFFVFSSLYEGFPNALVEAMVCGIPVISMDCPSGPREILGESKFGLLLEYESTSWLESYERISPFETSVVNTIKSLSKSEKDYSRYAKVSTERVKDFSISVISNKWKCLLS